MYIDDRSHPNDVSSVLSRLRVGRPDDCGDTDEDEVTQPEIRLPRCLLEIAPPGGERDPRVEPDAPPTDARVLAVPGDDAG